MSPQQANASEASSRFPRVSGDEPVESASLDMLREFSPREWG